MNIIGKTIKAAKIAGESLELEFEDGTKCEILDGGQDCCEERYMTTDDDVKVLIGGKIVEIRSEDGPKVSDEREVHEMQFLRIITDKAHVTLETHNKHNGYYGGFKIVIKELK